MHETVRQALVAVAMLAASLAPAGVAPAGVAAAAAVGMTPDDEAVARPAAEAPAASSQPAPSGGPEPAAPAISLVVEGQVSDRFGRPLAGRTVELRDDVATLASAATDAEGRYRLSATVPPGERFLVVLEGGRVELEERLVVSPFFDGETLTRDLRQQPVSRGAAGSVGASAPLPYTAVRVFYATDRARGQGSEPGGLYTSKRRGEDGYDLGSAMVTIPKDHRLAELETPSIWKLELQADPARHVVLASVTPQDPGTFYGQVRERVGRSARHEAFVFVHGFNARWEDTLRVSGQLAYDLQFDGAPIVFSWPSGDGLATYPQAEATAEWATAHLLAFLRDLGERTGATSVHLIAHSMGSRLVTRALSQLAAGEAARQPLFNQVVLAAPDMDAAVFRQLAADVARAGNRVTLYASSNDEVLKASMRLHAYPRAGLSGDGLVVVPGVETVDVSAVDSSLLGHRYYRDSGSIVGDLYTVLRNWLPAAQRRHLRALGEGARQFWQLIVGPG